MGVITQLPCVQPGCRHVATAFLANTAVFPASGNLGSPASLDFDAELEETGWGGTELAQGHVGGWRRAVVAWPQLSVGLVSLGTVTRGLGASVGPGRPWPR